MQIAEKLVRKQFLIHPRQLEKLKSLAKREKLSQADLVRRAIDAYDPDNQFSNLEGSELIDLALLKVKEALTDTQKTRKALNAALETADKRGDDKLSIAVDNAEIEALRSFLNGSKGLPE